MIRINKILSYTVPMFGNKRSSPYATLEVTDGRETKIVKTKERNGDIYFTFRRMRCYIKNVGSLYSPKFVIT